MSLLLKIVDAKGVARTVQVKPGDRIQVAPGDTVTVVDPAQGAGVRVERVGNDLVIVYADGRVVLGSFFPADPAPVPESLAALKTQAAVGATGLPTLIFENADGVNIVNALGSEVASSSSGELFQGGGQLPESFSLPENAAARQGGESGNPVDSGALATENPIAQHSDPVIGPQDDTGLAIPVFDFQVASVEAREGGILVFTVARSGGTQAATVTISTSSGTAIQGADFSNYSSGTLSFASGELTKTLTILALPDNVLEVSESFSVVLSNPTNGAQLGSVTTSTGVIRDPSFTITSAQAGEGGAVTFTVTRDGDAPGPQAVEYSTFDATATTTAPGAPGLGHFDYSPVVGTLTFSQGETAKTFTVNLTDDAVFDDVTPETFGVTLTNPAGGSLIDSGVATATILDNDAAPTFAISGGGADSEGGGALVYTVTRTGDAERPQTVQIGTGGGTATAGADYVPNATLLTFTQGETVKTFTVTLSDDGLFEIAESVGATLSNPNFGSITTGSAAGTISDNDPVPVFQVTGGSAFEGDGLVFTVSRSTDAETPQAVTVTTALTAGDNGQAADFTSVSTAVTFNQGELTKTVTVQSVEDLLQEGGETFSVTLSNATNGAVINPAASSAQGLIIDDDISNLIISDTSVAEGGGSLVFTVIRTLNAPGVTHFVEYSVVDGSATAADNDYTPVAAGTLTFTDGVLSQQIAVPITDDTTFEFGETVRVVLSNPTTSAGLPPEFPSGAPSVTALGTIQNDDPEPTISIAVDPATTPADLEDGNIVFNVVRSAGAAPNQLVQFSTVPGTAVGAAGAGDFTANSGTLTFTGGQLTQSITVSVTDDSTFDSAATENLTVTLGATNFGTVSTATAVGQIEDDDPTPEYSLAVSGPANEGNPGTPGAYTFTITRDRLSDETQVVNFSTALSADPDAAAGTDISGGFATTAVTFAANQLTRTVVVNAVSDNAFEANETFLGSLSGSGNFTINGGATVATGTILNDDPAPTYNISVSAPASEGNPPGSGGAFTFTITRDRLSTETQVVGFSTAQAGGANAAEPEDLAAGTFDVTPVEITFAPTQLSQTVVVNAQADDTTEVSEVFFGSLTTVTGGGTLTLGTATVATATIVSDDPDPVYTLSVNGPLPEDVAGVASTFTFTITRTRTAEDAQTVDFATVLGGGPNDAEGTDFGQVAATTVTFLPTDGLTKTVTVVTTPDTQYEVDGTNRDEGFRGIISNPQGGAVLGAQTVATAIITDNDAGPQLSVTDASASEGGGVEFTVTRTGDAESVQTVRFVAMVGGGGGGINPAESGDFSQVTGTLTFNPGDTSQNFTIPTSQDALFEPDEVFLVSLFSATNGAVITAATATGTIANEDPIPVFNIADASEDENDGALVFTVTRTSDAAEAQTVEVGLAAGGSATAGADYVDIATATTLTFTPGQTSATFTVSLLDDTLQEGLENVLVTLANPGGGAVLGTDAATGTIVDNDIPTFRIQPLAVSATEGGAGALGTLTFTITRTLDSVNPQTVDFSIASGTAILGTDTSAVSPLTVLTFTQGELTKTFEVAVSNDTIFELAETVTASISNAGGLDPANIDPDAATAIGTIIDNEIAPSVTIAQTSAGAEPGTGIVFTVTRDLGSLTSTVAPVQTVTVSTVAGGTNPATAGADYTAVTNQVLTFTGNETTETFTVPVLDDALDEVAQEVLATLTGITGGAVAGTQTLATGVINDNDTPPTFSIANVNTNEGALGTNGVLTFAVVRTGNAEATQVVNYATALGGSNPAGTLDFSAAGSSLVWTSTDVGALATKTFTVQATGDNVFEGDETFLVTLTGDPLTATPATATLATGTINNDDAAPVYSLALTPAAANEGNSGAGGAFTFTVTRDRSSDQTQVVNFSTTGVGANPAETGDVAGGFVTNLGVTFAAGQLSQTVVVNAQADTDFEGTETFLGSLTTGSGTLTINSTASAATATITTDDTTPPVYNLVSVSAPAADSEGDAGTGGAVTFTIVRNIRSDDTQVVNFSTALAGGATAAEAGDLIGGFTTTAVTFGAADLTRTVVVNAAGDTVFEGNEIFLGSLTTAAGGGSLTLGTGTLLTGSIDDNEVAPVYSLDSVTAPALDSEGNAGTGGAVTFTITRNILSEQTQVVTLRTASAGGLTGAEGSDLIGGFGDTAVTFGVGDLTRTVVVNAAGDTTFEDNELFTGSLTTAAGGGTVTIGSNTLLTASIDDDDNPPTLAIGLASGVEGTAGAQGTLTFTVTRTGDAEGIQTVEYADISPAAARPATAGADYTAIPAGTLTFTQGQTTGGIL